MTNDQAGELKSVFTSFSEKYNAKISNLQTQVDSLDRRSSGPNHSGGGLQTKTLAEEIFEAEAFRQFAETGHGRVALKIENFQRKTTILGSSLGTYVTGVVMGERQPGIVPAPLRTFRVRELLRTVPTEAAGIDFVKTTTYSQASPQSEGSVKAEATINFVSVSEMLKTLAIWIPISRQAIQDVASLGEAVNTHLLAGLADAEDGALLFGDGVTSLHGLALQASSFNPSLLGSSWQRADILGRAIQQLAEARYPTEGIVLSPRDWWDIVLLKDSQQRYLLANPAEMTATTLWGIPVSVTDAMPAGSFLVGAFQTGAAFYLRMDAVVEVSDSHADFFVRNQLALRAEERGALACYKPGAFVSGTFSSSPA